MTSDADARSKFEIKQEIGKKYIYTSSALKLKIKTKPFPASKNVNKLQTHQNCIPIFWRLTPIKIYFKLFFLKKMQIDSMK